MTDPYIVPQALVYQELQTVPSELIDPLRPHVSGGHAWLTRYAEADEKVNGALGAYDPAIDQVYAWPHRPLGAKIDLSYTKLFLDNALLRYFQDPIGAGSTIAAVAGRKDRVRASALAFRTNTASYPRSADFYDRDVAVGDTVYLRGVVSAENVELWTTVRGFAYEQTAAVTSATVNDSTNATTRSASYSATFTGGTENCIDLLADLTDYNSWVDGNIDDVYTVTVLQGSVDGDFTTASVRLTSASGVDDVLSFTPDADGVYVSVGSRGLQLAFTVGGSGSSCSGDEPGTANDLVAGQSWTLTVYDDSQAAVGTSGGTYTGLSDTTYIVEVTRGGKFADADATKRPQITVRSVSGTDLSGPTDVVAESTAYAAGTKGVTITFTKSAGTLLGLRKGDKFNIAVTASKDGRASTLILANGLGDLVDATDLELKLFIKQDLQISQNRTGFAPLTNWDATATEFTVNSALTVYHSSWTDDGVQLPLDVVGGDLFVEYRAWLQTLIRGGSLNDIGELNDVISGPLTPDNPLKWGVYYAALNSNFTTVHFHAVSDPDDTDTWLDVLEELDGREDVYNLVPLTYNQTVLNAYAGHVAAQSSAEAGRWRAMFCGIQVDDSVAVVSSATSTDGELVLAVIEDDPETSGSQYTYLVVPLNNGQFVTNEVQAGDIVRIGYTTDGFDGVVYDEYTVDTVINEDVLRLAAGPVGAVSTPQKIEIWHTRTKTELAQAIAAKAGSYGSQRVCAVWPDLITSGGTTMSGFYAAAAAAGRRGGIVPQQGMTNLALTGFDDVSRTTKMFNATQLNILAAGGVYIITQNPSGAVFARHALTTDQSGNLGAEEETARANLDSISYFFLRAIRKYIGVANVTPQLLAILRVELDSAIDQLKTNSLVARIGAQLIDGTVTDLRAHLVYRDRVIAVITLDRPYPLNRAEVYLVG